MITLTPKLLQRYLRDYDYNISLETSTRILQYLDDYYGHFTSDEIFEAAEQITKEVIL